MTASTSDQGEIRVLGAFEVVAGGRPVECLGPKERTVLALLAARSPWAVSAECLIDELWGDEAPDAAATTLRSYVSTLRRALRRSGLEDLVVTDSAGYRLDPERASLDASVFEALLRRSRQHHDTAPGVEAEMLRAALRLWRGEALGGVATTPELTAWGSRLAELRLMATERWLDAELACGHHDEVAAEVTSLCEVYPWRERLWVQRLLALYRSGRQGEALVAASEIGERLSVLGLQPSQELGAMEQAIRQRDPALDLPAAPLAPERPSGPGFPSSKATPWVGRKAELATLERLWASSLSGGPHVVLVTGPQGIGKSSLVSTWAQALLADGVSVLSATCRSSTGGPFQPIVEALRPLLPGLSADERLSIVPSRCPPEFAMLLPELFEGPAPTPSLGPSDRRMLFESLGELFEAVASTRAVALLLDDIQEADPSTVQLVTHLADRRGSCEPLLVLIGRDEPGARSPVIDELRERPNVVEISLEGLAKEEVFELVATVAPVVNGDTVPLAELLRRTTEGNPLFLRQLLAHMMVEPEAFVRHGGVVADPPVALGMREVIDRRLRALPPDAAAVLEVAALVGSDLDVELLETLCQPLKVTRALEVGLSAGLLEAGDQPGAPCRFAHLAIRTACAQQLESSRRSGMHHRIAELRERRGGEGDTLEVVAHHYLAAAEPGDGALGARYALLAGTHALDALAFEQAAEFARSGLSALQADEPSHHELACRLHVLLSRASLQLRDIRVCKLAAWAAGDEARVLGSSALLGEAAELASYLNVIGERDEATASLCKDALRALEVAERHGQAAIVLAGWADCVAVSQGDSRGAEPLSAEALALARRSNNLQALSRCLYRHAEMLGWTPRTDDRLALSEELVAVGRAGRDPFAEANGHHLRALALLELGDLAGFDASVREVDSLRQSASNWYLDVFGLLWVGMRALLEGRLDDAESVNTEVLTRFGDDPNVAHAAFGQLGWIRREQGRLGELVAVLEHAVAEAPGLTALRCGLAVSFLETGRPELAGVELDRLARNGFADLPTDAAWTTSLALLTEVVAQLGDQRCSEALLPLLAPYRGHFLIATKGAVCLGAADRFLAMLHLTVGRSEEAEGLLRTAESLERQAGAPLLVARTRRWRGRLELITS